MSKRPIYKKVRQTLHETVSDSGKSVLSYRGNNDKIYYVPSSDDPNVEPGSDLKTINGESLKGEGDIAVATPIPIIEVSGDNPEQELAPNTFYQFGAVDSLTLTLGTPTSSVLNVYMFAFTASESFDPSEDLSLPEDVLLNGEIDMEAGDECEVSIRGNRGVFTVWSVPAADPVDVEEP